MNKKSAIISRIKNGIGSIISRLKKRNIEPGVTKEKEQTVDSEPISRSENKTETLAPDKKELNDLKKELGESIATILNKLFDGISGLLEKEYKDRLIGLEKSIEELKKKEKEKVVLDLKTYKEELEDVRNLAETAKSISEGNIEKIAKITMEESEIEVLKGKVSEIRLTDILADKSKGTTTVSDYTKQASEGDIGTISGLEESEILELKDKIEKIEEIEEIKLSDIPIEKIAKIRSIIEKMKQEGKNIPKEEDLEDIEKLFFSERLAALIPAEDREPLKQPLPDSMPLKKVIEDIVYNVTGFEKRLEGIRKELKQFIIESSYRKGISLLKKEAYEDAKECFDEIITMNPNIKGAWLNRGVASGGLGDIKEEIACYDIALRKDKKYEKALHNKKIAGRKIKRTK
jgi:tetratricopeptide (TPR) repeat protein